MKKFYSILAIVIISALGFNSHAFQITLNIDNPANVSVTKDYGSPLEITAGDNILSTDGDYMNITISVTSDNFIKSVVRKSDNSTEYVSNLSQCNLYVDSSRNGETYTVTTASSTDMRDATCRVYVDNASKVQMQRSGTYSRVTLNDGWNDVKFISGTESPLLISSNDYYTPLYKVEVNGSPAVSYGGTWNAYVNDGDEVTITSEYPDIDIPVHFIYAEGSEGCISAVTVNDIPSEDYNSANFTVKAGSRIRITGDTQSWGFDSFKINGSSASFYGSYEQTITEETDFEFTAHRFAMFKVGITIDNPEHVRAYRGYSYENNIIPLNPGHNEVEFSETNAMMQVVAESGCFISSISDGTNELKDNYIINVTDGMELTIVTGAINRDKTAIFYIDDRSAATQYFNFGRSDRSTIDISTGYNTIAFYDGDNKFGLSWYGAEYANVIQNGEAVSPIYENSTTYELTFADGDIIKVYLASNPEECNVRFNVEGDGNMVSVTRDIIDEVTAWEDGFTVLEGTRLHIAPAESHHIMVSIDGTPVDADEDGSCDIDITDDTDITVNVDDYDSVEGIITDTDRHVDVYNMQGIPVVRNASPDRIDALPAGLYIIDGKKVFKR